MLFKRISLSQAAKSTGYTPEYLNLLCRKKKLRGEKIEGKWFTTEEWLKKFLENNKTNGKGGGANLLKKEAETGFSSGDFKKNENKEETVQVNIVSPHSGLYQVEEDIRKERDQYFNLQDHLSAGGSKLGFFC